MSKKNLINECVGLIAIIVIVIVALIASFFYVTRQPAHAIKDLNNTTISSLSADFKLHDATRDA